jgi:hypothetical protein
MAPRVNRGEVRLYTFGSPDKRRPVLVLSRIEAGARNCRGGPDEGVLQTAAGPWGAPRGQRAPSEVRTYANTRAE